MDEVNLEEEYAKQRRIDEASYELYEKTKKETISNMKSKLKADGSRKYSDKKIEEQINMIQEMQDEIIEDYKNVGGNPEDLKKFSKTTTKKKKSTVVDELLDVETVVSKTTETNIVEVKKTDVLNVIPNRDEDDYGAYDIIPLPSNGECYKEKIGRIPVAYLNAYDENMIVSPNLYRDNLLIDTILKEKILNDTIDPADMLEGDRDAIIVWLRSSGYGPEYPIVATDDITGEAFNTNIDLSTIQPKEFKLKGDVNGWFDYTLPVCKKEIKFRFLTHRDNVRLREIEEEENVKLMKNRLTDIVERLDEFIDDDKILNKTEKIKTQESIRNIEKWAEKYEDVEGAQYTNAVTNRLEASIMSVDGITNRQMIKKFVKTMCVKDSASLRKYISENEPGMDFNIEIQKPENLGSGSMKTFLQLDELVFLRLPEGL